MKLRRGERLSRRVRDATARRRGNAVSKQKERARRDARMISAVESGTLPYTPDVMSWISRRLNKPSRRITAEDIAALRRR